MIMEMGAQNTHLYDVENLVTSSLKKGQKGAQCDTQLQPLFTFKKCKSPYSVVAS